MLGNLSKKAGGPDSRPGDPGDRQGTDQMGGMEEEARGGGGGWGDFRASSTGTGMDGPFSRQRPHGKDKVCSQGRPVQLLTCGV